MPQQIRKSYQRKANYSRPKANFKRAKWFHLRETIYITMQQMSIILFSTNRFTLIMMLATSKRHFSFNISILVNHLFAALLYEGLFTFSDLHHNSLHYRFFRQIPIWTPLYSIHCKMQPKQDMFDSTLSPRLTSLAWGSRFLCSERNLTKLQGTTVCTSDVVKNSTSV